MTNLLFFFKKKKKQLPLINSYLFSHLIEKKRFLNNNFKDYFNYK